MKGPKGDSVQVSIGSVTASALQTSDSATAIVSAVQSDSQVLLNFSFGLPRGTIGAQGVPGGFGTPTATAYQFESDATPAAEVTASGPDSAKIFSFTFGIPKGRKGDTGAAAGFGTPQANIVMLNSNSTAAVTISDSGSDQEKIFKFSFYIPRGAQGLPGATPSISTTNQHWIIDNIDTDVIANALWVPWTTLTYASNISLNPSDGLRRRLTLIGNCQINPPLLSSTYPELLL